MSTRRALRWATYSSAMGLLLLVSGCDSKREVGEPAGKATAATEVGGAETTASPGGPNVTPDQATPPVSR